MEQYLVKVHAREGGEHFLVPRAKLEPLSRVVSKAPAGNLEVVSCGLLCARARELFLSFVLTEVERDDYFMNNYRVQLAQTEVAPFADLMNLAASLQMKELLEACRTVLLSRAPKAPTAKE